LFESEEKLENASESLKQNQYADSIYYSYLSIVNTAKALLISEGKKTNTHAGIIEQFEEVFASEINLDVPFSDFIYQIKNNEPSQEFAQNYLIDAQSFYKKVDAFRANIVAK
jgi:sulfite reductase (ferredoxin)